MGVISTATCEGDRTTPKPLRDGSADPIAKKERQNYPINY